MIFTEIDIVHLAGAEVDLRPQAGRNSKLALSPAENADRDFGGIGSVELLAADDADVVAVEAAQQIVRCKCRLGVAELDVEIWI